MPPAKSPFLAEIELVRVRAYDGTEKRGTQGQSVPGNLTVQLDTQTNESSS